MRVDIPKIVRTLLERQKEYVREDRERYSCAMAVVISPDGTHLDFPKFQTEEEKIAAYSRIVAFAKEHRASAIITINQSRTLWPHLLHELETSQWGEFDETNSDPCILVTVTGPGVPAYSMALPYQITDSGVEFGELEVLEKTEVYLLPNWPDSPSHRAN